MPKLGGGVEGFNIDLVNEAGQRMGRKVEIFAAEFSGPHPGDAGRQDRFRRRAHHGDAGARRATALHRRLSQHLLPVRRRRRQARPQVARRPQGQGRVGRTRARPTTSGARQLEAKLGWKGESLRHQRRRRAGGDRRAAPMPTSPATPSHALGGEEEPSSSWSSCKSTRAWSGPRRCARTSRCATPSRTRSSA